MPQLTRQAGGDKRYDLWLHASLQTAEQPSEDYLEMIRLLFLRMKARGHDPSSLKKMFMSAANKLELKAPKPKEQGDSNNRLFIHMQYHPNGISRQEIRAAFEETCDSFRGTAAEVGKVTVAFSRPPNLKDKLTSARLHEVPGKEASTYRPSERIVLGNGRFGEKVS